MASVVDSMAWDEEVVRSRTRLENADVGELQLYFDAAKEAADDYLNNPFVDDDDADIPIPARVQVGVYRLCQEEFLMAEDERTDAVTSVKTHLVSASFASPEAARCAIAQRYWSSYRLIPGF